METKSTLPSAVAVRPPASVHALNKRFRPELAARREPDPEHRFHAPARPGDSRAVVAAGGAMVRVRSRRPEFHKKAEVTAGLASGAPAPRQIHGGLVSKRRVGK